MLSVKAREIDEEKQAMAEFGSSDSGASLGDILGAALSRAQKKDEKEETKRTSKVALQRLSERAGSQEPAFFLGKMALEGALGPALRVLSF